MRLRSPTSPRGATSRRRTDPPGGSSCRLGPRPRWELPPGPRLLSTREPASSGREIPSREAVLCGCVPPRGRRISPLATIPARIGGRRLRGRRLGASSLRAPLLGPPPLGPPPLAPPPLGPPSPWAPVSAAGPGGNAPALQLRVHEDRRAGAAPRSRTSGAGIRGGDPSRADRRCGARRRGSEARPESVGCQPKSCRWSPFRDRGTKKRPLRLQWPYISCPEDKGSGSGISRERRARGGARSRRKRAGGGGPRERGGAVDPSPVLTVASTPRARKNGPCVCSGRTSAAPRTRGASQESQKKAALGEERVPGASERGAGDRASGRGPSTQVQCSPSLRPPGHEKTAPALAVAVHQLP